MYRPLIVLSVLGAAASSSAQPDLSPLSAGLTRRPDVSKRHWSLPSGIWQHAGAPRTRSESRSESLSFGCAMATSCRPARHRPRRQSSRHASKLPSAQPTELPLQPLSRRRRSHHDSRSNCWRGGGALALGGIGCLAGAWMTAQQVTSADLTFENGTALLDRGRALNGAGIALTVTGGAMVIGGVVTWVVLARRGGK